MKQLSFMIIATLCGTLGPILLSRPVLGVAVYYLFAVLRPQFIWEWSLPANVAWSFYVALATLLSVSAWALGVIRPHGEDQRQPGRSRLTSTHIAFLAFAFWICLTYFTAYDRDVSYPYFVEYLKIFTMWIISSFVIRNVKQVWALYLLVTVALGYIAYEVNFIYFFQGHYIFIYRRGYGGLDNNGAGLMIAMGVPLCLFAWEAIRKWYGWVFIALIPAMVHAVMLSYSRGAMLSLLVTLPLYILRSRRRLQLCTVLVGLACAVPLLAGPEIKDRFFSISDQDKDESANSRKTSWAIGWRMAKERPLLGLGIRNSNLFTHAYGADIEGRTIHSQYLQTAADSGLVGMGLYGLVLASGWLSARRARREVASRVDESATRIYAMSYGVQGSLAVFCFGAAFLSLENFELPYILLLLAAQLALLAARTSTADARPLANPGPPREIEWLTPSKL